MNWDDLKYFLAVARSGQMLGAAQNLGVSQALLSRHIASLEAAVGARLLDRTTRGCTMTEDGRVLFESAELIEAEVLSGLSRLKRDQDDISGTIRIGTPDGFGSAFLAPRLDRFRAAFPNLHIQLVPVPRSFSLSQREADIAIMVGRPEKGRLRVRKLTGYTLSLYASKTYIERMGMPARLQDLSQHSLVGYVDDLIYTPELNYAGDFLRDWKSDIEVSTALGQFEAVKAGAGIGILHDFMVAGDQNFVPLFPERFVQRDYWIVWHENMRAERRVLALAGLIDELIQEARPLFLRDAGV